jgi:protein TonB
MRAPVILILAAGVTLGLFLMMRQLIWVESAPIEPRREMPNLVINYEPPEIDPVRTTTPDDIVEIEPPPAVEPLPTGGVDPGAGPGPAVYNPPPIDPPTVSTGGPINLDAYATPVLRREPIYPQRMAERGVSGHCILRFDVGPNGETANVRIVECSNSGFERASVRAVSQWRYRPATTEGRARWMRNLEVRLDYRLNA